MFHSIPENFKNAWFGLITILFMVLIIFLIIVGARLVHGPRGTADSPATITVNGKGQIKATPDVSRFMITIEETAKEQSAALDKTSTKVATILAELQKVGIEERDIKTEYTSINPNYEYQSAGRGGAEIMIYPPVPGKQVITGYQSSHTLSVKVRDLTKVPVVQKIFVDAQVQNVSGPELSIDDPEKLQQDARQKAIDDAKSKAGILSQQLGVRLGKIISFSDANDGGVYPMYMSARAGDAMMEKTAVAPDAVVATGEQTITSNVSITYKIR